MRMHAPPRSVELSSSLIARLFELAIRYSKIVDASRVCERFPPRREGDENARTPLSPPVFAQKRSSYSNGEPAGIAWRGYITYENVHSRK